MRSHQRDLQVISLTDSSEEMVSGIQDIDQIHDRRRWLRIGVDLRRRPLRLSEQRRLSELVHLKLRRRRHHRDLHPEICCSSVRDRRISQTWAEVVTLETTLLQSKSTMDRGAQWQHWLRCDRSRPMPQIL